MANELNLVTWSGSTVTPLDDALIYEKFSANSGIINGGSVTIKNSSTLHIDAGNGIICGRKFTITDSDIPVELSGSGTLLGRLYIHLDLASVSDPIELLVETGLTLTDEVQQTDANINTGVWDMNIATFTVDTVTLDSLVDIAPEVQNNNRTVATIEDTTKSANAYSAGDYLVHRGILRKVLSSISVGDVLEEGTNIEATDVGAALKAIGSSLVGISSFTIPSGVSTYTLSDPAITATNKVFILFDVGDDLVAQDAGLKVTAQTTGSITFTCDSALTASVTGSGVAINV